MSIVNPIQSDTVPQNAVFADYKTETSSSVSDYEGSGKLNDVNKTLLKHKSGAYGSDETYSVSLAVVRQETENTISKLNQFKVDLENLLRQVNLDPFNNPSLDEAHKYVWDQINVIETTFPKIQVEGYLGELKYPRPPFICFDQYIF